MGLCSKWDILLHFSSFASRGQQMYVEWVGALIRGLEIYKIVVEKYFLVQFFAIFSFSGLAILCFPRVRKGLWPVDHDPSNLSRSWSKVECAGNLCWCELQAPYTAVSYTLEDVRGGIEVKEAQPDAHWLHRRTIRRLLKEEAGKSEVAPDSFFVHVKHFFTFLLAEVGGRLQFVMLKYERTGPGRVKAHGRGLFVYFGL